MATVGYFLVLTTFAAFLFVIVRGLVTGAIRTKGLLNDLRTGIQSPARVQMLVISLYAMGAYAFQAVTQHSAPGATPTMPEPSNFLIGSLGASHGLYLGSKMFNKWIGR